ncbi:YtxH domain-containing protein [Larkinella terrae]|uniref:YtxH domain-containing protein n=1 Tax=Larkinella terrae TaxID=2025311 RepID=A0A7K0EKV1_9BACT|nr:YtxH domain-containing protein [Larkinella terrae]MRS62480.1 YtxH domain-containing protein [Larkinella terrae]
MKSNFSGLLVAILTGAALGLLLAPRSGKDTRKKISNDSDKFLKDLQDTIADGFNSIRNQYDDTKQNLTSKYNDAVDTVASRTKGAVERIERNSKH